MSNLSSWGLIDALSFSDRRPRLGSEPPPLVSGKFRIAHNVLSGEVMMWLIQNMDLNMEMINYIM